MYAVVYYGPKKRCLVYNVLKGINDYNKYVDSRKDWG